MKIRAIQWSTPQVRNTLVDPTHCFRYTEIVHNKEKIAYHVWEAGYLADQANIKQANQKKREQFCVYNILI